MYKKGDIVKVQTLGGIFQGKIREVIDDYGFSGEIKYLVIGDNIETITSERCILNDDVLFMTDQERLDFIGE